MKIAYISCLVMFALAAIVTILQMWLEFMAWDIYLKVIATLGLLFLVILGTALARREYLSDSKLRNEGYID
tara:strand:- start:591 stop:803 length:213 start_codon:yes stop_codon:yes gene_type:complete